MLGVGLPHTHTNNENNGVEMRYSRFLSFTGIDVFAPRSHEREINTVIVVAVHGRDLLVSKHGQCGIWQLEPILQRGLHERYVVQLARS